MNHQRTTKMFFILLCLAALSVAYLWNKTAGAQGQPGDTQVHSTMFQVLSPDQDLLEEQRQMRNDLERLRSNGGGTNSVFQPVAPNPALIEENNQVREELREAR